MTEQKPLIEEPKPTGPGKDPEVCGTCRYQRTLDNGRYCHLEPQKAIQLAGAVSWEHPRADDDWPGCRHYVHREIRRDR